MEILTEVFWVVRRLLLLLVVQLRASVEAGQEKFELLPKELFAPPQNEVGLQDQLQLGVEVLVVEVVEEHDDQLFPFLRFKDLVEDLLEFDFLPLVFEEVLGQEQHNFL